MFSTRHQRKSVLLTSILIATIFLSMYYFGLPYQDPPAEYGLALNFGFQNAGSDAPQTDATYQNTEDNIEPQEESKEELTQEELIQNQNSEAPPNINPGKPKKKDTKTKPVKKIVSKETQSALSNLLKNTKKSQGNDNQQGIKGNENSTPSPSYASGNGGKNYNLSGRTVLKKIIFEPQCNEEGTVFVRIEVNQNGKVVKATAGVKGSTNTNPCLLEPARKAALQTRWNVDKNAPKKQVGIIIYRFRLSK